MRNEREDPMKRLKDIEEGRLPRKVDEDDPENGQARSLLPFMLPTEFFTTRAGWVFLVAILIFVGLVRLIVHLLR